MLVKDARNEGYRQRHTSSLIAMIGPAILSNEIEYALIDRLCTPVELSTTDN